MFYFILAISLLIFMLIDDGAMLNLLDQKTELFLVHNNTSDYLRTKISFKALWMNIIN